LLFLQAEDGIRDRNVTGVQTCALPIFTQADGQLNKRIIGQVEWEKKSISHIPLDEKLTKEWLKQVFNDLAETEHTRYLASSIFRSEERRVGKESRSRGRREK